MTKILRSRGGKVSYEQKIVISAHKEEYTIFRVKPDGSVYGCTNENKLVKLK